jgi:phospholipid-binding lipoprotein MlaA
LLLLFSGCAPIQVGEHEVADPLEKVNRASYNLVELVETIIIKPLAFGYRKLLPAPIRRGVANFFHNIRTVDSAVNGLLQGKPKSAATDVARVLINTTVGIGGLFDVATGMGLKFQDEDFGQTLAVWGYKRSRYIYFPIVGPTTVRDLPGALWQRILTPRLILGDHYNLWTGSLDTISYRSQRLSDTEIRDETALDPYVFTREAWSQRRRFQIFDGEPETEDFFDEYFEDEEDSESSANSYQNSSDFQPDFE